MKLEIALIALVFVGVPGCGDDGSAPTEASSGSSSGGSEGTESTMTDAGSSAGPSSGETDPTDPAESGASSGGTAEDASSSGGPLPEVDFETDVQPIINANCTCHLAGPSGTMAASTLNMNPGNAHANLVGVPSTEAPLSLVEPGATDQSYLWHKIERTHESVGGNGTPMPPAGTLLPAERRVIEAWIASGAAP